MQLREALQKLDDNEVEDFNLTTVKETSKLTDDDIISNAIYIDFYMEKFLDHYGLTPDQADNLGMKFTHISRKPSGWWAEITEDITEANGSLSHSWVDVNIDDIMNHRFAEADSFMHKEVLAANAKRFSGQPKPIVINMPKGNHMHISFN